MHVVPAVHLGAPAATIARAAPDCAPRRNGKARARRSNDRRHSRRRRNRGKNVSRSSSSSSNRVVSQVVSDPATNVVVEQEMDRDAVQAATVAAPTAVGGARSLCAAVAQAVGSTSRAVFVNEEKGSLAVVQVVHAGCEICAAVVASVCKDVVGDSEIAAAVAGGLLTHRR